ncbi:hypothetical protein CALVIDRAFT_487228 [Calocera viscosa TUFC12733]|uniref:SprT-like domain-containing protein n=1 Tax=Calocera viscosa (strain TUFC12733) TaxID=1330018 RepID=A0A167IDB2_CALVF|nr:hypothetical protein CALVIDRAFT_487228 [Calocera viscosa TUFC12733]
MLFLYGQLAWLLRTFELTPNSEPSRRPSKRTQVALPPSTPSRTPHGLKTPSKSHRHEKEVVTDEADHECVLLLSSSEDDLPASPLNTTNTPKAKKTPSRNTADTPRKTPGRGRKALQVRLEKLAEETVSQLNTLVFDGRIPEDIELIWSKRLNTTAGRANWKRIRKESGDDIHQCSIELSTKVLDNEERVLNTVAHELCHLAAWVINGEIQPAHGRCFKGWGRKVMKSRPDIHITTRHDYEIAYRYEWRCANPACARTYGRHSKSINPDQHACGVCKGKLEPMFQTYSPTKRTAFQGKQISPTP